MAHARERSGQAEGGSQYAAEAEGPCANNKYSAVAGNGIRDGYRGESGREPGAGELELELEPLRAVQSSPFPFFADQLRDHTGQKAKYWLILKEIRRAAPCFFLRVLAWY
jgi:hypothetical protein